MPVIFVDISPGKTRWSVKRERRRPCLLGVCLIRADARPGEPQIRLGVPLLDEYLALLAGRCRPNTVLAVGYDLKVFFTVVGKSPEDVQPVDVLAFVTAQRSARASNGRVLQPVDEDTGGVSLRTVRRRLSSMSGLYAFLHACGHVPANPVRRGLPTQRERQRPRQGVPLVRRVRTVPHILAPPR